MGYQPAAAAAAVSKGVHHHHMWHHVALFRQAAVRSPRWPQVTPHLLLGVSGPALEGFDHALTVCHVGQQAQLQLAESGAPPEVRPGSAVKSLAHPAGRESRQQQHHQETSYNDITITANLRNITQKQHKRPIVRLKSTSQTTPASV